MIRSFWYFIKIAVVVFVAIWLANRPGAVSLEWLGYRIDTSVGIVLLGAFLFGILTAVTYRFWGMLLRSPKAIGALVERGRLKRGYKALTQGMVAVAAGDPGEAQRLATKADGLLREPPLTLLLQAQAAQLQGDEGAAQRYFETMLDNPETRFLGLRGLMTQSLREGDEAAALAHARKAHEMRPKTPWLLEMLFDLSERTGDYVSADKAVKAWAKTKALSAPEGARKRAVLTIERAQEAEAEGRLEDALRLAREADKLTPNFLPATLLLARLLIETKRLKDAARLMERAWSAQPHPEFVALYKRARPSADPIEMLKNLNKLVEGWKAHEDSRAALAEAALDARLWGEARRYLGELISGLEGKAPSERVCWLMARLEESEHGDAKKVREWLLKAVGATPPAEWVCESCGTVAEGWSARCGACGVFDSLKWAEPPRVSDQAGLTVEAASRRSLPVPVEVEAETVEPAASVPAETKPATPPAPAPAQTPAPASAPAAAQTATSTAANKEPVAAEARSSGATTS